MPAYVDQYVQLEHRAADEESRAEDYKARAEQDRWEQCRIAHEAIESGEYSQASFAQEVGKNPSTISRQISAWKKHGRDHDHGRGPSYTEAWAEALGQVGDRTERGQLSSARQVLADPKLARQVLADPDVRRKLMSNDNIRADLSRTTRDIDAQRAARVARKTRESAPKLAEAKEFYDALSRLTHARQDVNKALDLLRGLPPLDADGREQIRQETTWLSQSLDWLAEAVKARRTATLSDEIEQYLAEQGAN